MKTIKRFFFLLLIKFHMNFICKTYGSKSMVKKFIIRECRSKDFMTVESIDNLLYYADSICNAIRY